MLAFDASSMIYAWDNYPESQFPLVWRWIAERLERNEFAIPEVAFYEVGHKLPDCAAWLRTKDILIIKIDNDITQEALRIKNLLHIEGDSYHPSGVDENDIFIIATSKARQLELVSEEARQKNPPSLLAKMKIPAVCSLPAVEVSCINFIELIKRSQIVFG